MYAGAAELPKIYSRLVGLVGAVIAVGGGIVTCALIVQSRTQLGENNATVDHWLSTSFDFELTDSQRSELLAGRKPIIRVANEHGGQLIMVDEGGDLAPEV